MGDLSSDDSPFSNAADHLQWLGAVQVGFGLLIGCFSALVLLRASPQGYVELFSMSLCVPFAPVAWGILYIALGPPLRRRSRGVLIALLVIVALHLVLLLPAIGLLAIIAINEPPAAILLMIGIGWCAWLGWIILRLVICFRVPTCSPPGFEPVFPAHAEPLPQADGKGVTRDRA